MKPAERRTAPHQWPLLGQWLGPGLIALAFLLLTIWSWRKWPDLLVDFGQQLYIPWQLASGRHLYSDIAFMHGPLSQHFNALWFRIFGPSLTVLIFVNLSILGATTAVIYRIVRLFGDRLTATTACIVLLCVFAFSEYVVIGNYNFVCPYTHEATHGVALTAGMILLLSRYVTRGGRAACASAGMCLGFALLTKVDVALAAAGVAGLGLVAGLLVKGWAASMRGAVLLTASAVAPALMFLVYFLSYLPPGQALTAIGGGFSFPASEVARNPFYLRVLGLDNVGENVWRMASAFSLVAVFVLVAAAADVASARVLRHPGRLGAALGAALFSSLVLESDLLPWREIFRALPLTTLLALAVFATAFLKRDATDLRSAILPMLLWTTFALILLAKMALNVHVFHYGFYLAMPAALVATVCLTYWIPCALRSRFGCGVVFRSLALGVLAAGVVYHLNWSQHFYRMKHFPVGRGGDTILTYDPEVYPRGLLTAKALRWIEDEMPAGSTFTALPEGIMLNYLSRRITTLPQINFMMTEMIVFGEETMLAGLRQRPPDYVVLVHKDTSEFGVGPFGSDRRYGQQMMNWVNQHYEPLARIGDEPFRGNGFGIEILGPSHSPRP